jgi:formylmethanofuran:tetrahydromethanopterin formyltransferase
MKHNGYNIENKSDILDAIMRVFEYVKESDSIATRDANSIVARVVLAYVEGRGFEEAAKAEDTPPKRLGVSTRKLVMAEQFLRQGFKSRVQIANHLSITTDTVKTKVLPNLRRLHNVERERFGVTGKYKYRIASLTAYK